MRRLKRLATIIFTASLMLSSMLVAADPRFEVLPRTDHLEYYPCSMCHEHMEVNPTPRVLEEAPHYAEVNHGSAEMWCTTCHSLDDREKLRTLSGRLLEIDQGYLICGQCHSNVYEDWRYGAHGKRYRRWRGGREIQSCTSCHNPHTGPGISPRSPLDPPGVRQGLERQKHQRQPHCYRWKPCPNNNPEQTDAKE